MQNLILTATLSIVAICQNVTLAQSCSKTGGGHWGTPTPVHRIEQPRWRPLPPPAHHVPPVHHIEQPTCRPVQPAVNHDYHPVHVVKRQTTSIRSVPPHQDVAPEPVQRPQLECGQTVTIDGRFFGPQKGTITVEISGLVLQAQVVDWASTQAKAVLPVLPLTDPVQANVVVRSAYDKIAAQLDIELLPSGESVAPGIETALAPQSQLPVVSPGQNVTLDAANLGTTPGIVQISVGGLKLNATVSNWSNAQVTATLPALQIAEEVQARVEIITANGQVANHVDVMLAPATAAQVVVR